MRFQNVETGMIVDAIQLEGPMIVNTEAGERCGEANSWLTTPVDDPSTRPSIFDDRTFREKFIQVAD